MFPDISNERILTSLKDNQKAGPYRFETVPKLTKTNTAISLDTNSCIFSRSERFFSLLQRSVWQILAVFEVVFISNDTRSSKIEVIDLVNSTHKK